MLHDGLYEQVINEELEAELSESEKHLETAGIDEAEASKVLAQYIAEVVEKGLEQVPSSQDKLSSQIALANRIVATIEEVTELSEFEGMAISDRAEQLLALYDRRNSILAVNDRERVPRPETSIAQSSLFTGASREPQMFSELKKEILSCDRIDMLVSFIKWSGLRLIIDELKEFTGKGGRLRIITTSYMGATDIKAIEELQELPNTEIKVSYDTKRTRLHAKTYVFYRDSGFTTAYVGSSNLSNAAISSGLEWNVKVTHKDLPETIDKIAATFDSYWNSGEFELYGPEERDRLYQALRAEKDHDAIRPNVFVTDVQPYKYQQEILDALQAEREVHDRWRNLVVAATGTGKTVVAALDYKRFRQQHPGKPCRLLFVAHREEILKQSLYTFQAVLKDPDFGELFTGNYRPGSIDHLFVSIQTFNSQEFTEKVDPDFYDFVVVDEFHHAAAPSYKKLLSYCEPQILLGLTATPERMDGESILPYFGDRIAAEIRLPEAIELKLLCPFQYFGVTDTVDLDDVRWTRGGYDRQELSNVYTMSGAIAARRADWVVHSLLNYSTDISEVKALGFCVSVEHAKFMADHFNSAGIPAMALTGDSPKEERDGAKKRLVSGEIRVIFVVDIYNEGVDIPEVNTVLFLRPTESLTVFLQQLGRGLRLAEDKECLTVLDFIGQANKRYSFEDKFAALLTNTSKGVEREIKKGFTSLPKGCYIQLEKRASQYILENIRASYGNVAGLISKIDSFEEDSGKALNLANFLEYHHLDPRKLYKHGSFARLCERAGKHADFCEELEEKVTKALPRFASIDSRRWIAYLLEILPSLGTLDVRTMSALDQRMLQMFYVTIWGETADWNIEEPLDQLRLLSECPVMLEEIQSLLRLRYEQIDFVDKPVDLGFDCPLDLHCSYTRDQLLVAMDFMRPNTVREGVKWLEDKNIDVLFVTLNKSDKDYSPTTMYKDYSISSTLFHWQSQSRTSESSPTGQRYIHHKERGSKVLLFVREDKVDAVTRDAAPYCFLGTAEYVTHEGSRPMSIIWRLDNPIPAKYLKKTNRLVA